MRGKLITSWTELISLPKGTRIDEYSEEHGGGLVHELYMGHVTMKKDMCEMHYLKGKQHFQLTHDHYERVRERGNSSLYAHEQILPEELFTI